MHNYSFFSKTLHKLILNSSLIKKTAFDLDCLSNTSSRNILIEKPVYVSGLARAGTTIILNTIYNSGEFASLTYKDMPLVTAPQIWKKFFFNKNSKLAPKERTHGDSILIDLDSPESFEEIFWMTFENNSQQSYNCLKSSSSLSGDLSQIYLKYIKNVITSYSDNNKSQQLRYLSKNNNILRVEKIKNEIPSAIVIVPFRNPVDHANSLLNQHTKFIALQKKDPFVLTYMNWLGHFEFGLNFKPLCVKDGLNKFSFDQTYNINYWLEYWIAVHEYILIQYDKNNVIFLNYENLCKNPERTLSILENKLFVKDRSFKKSAKTIKHSKIYIKNNINSELLKKALDIFNSLEYLSI